MSQLLQTSLHASHIELGAKMVDFGGWSMPIQYNNLKEEVLAVRNKVGVFDVSHMGEFLITGPQALDYIDHLVTNDIKGAKPGKAIYSPLCRDNGTIIDDLIVYKFSDEDIFVCVNASNIEKDFNWFADHKGTFDCQLENLSDQYSLLALQGPESFKLLKECLSKVDDIEYYSIQEVKTDSPLRTFIARTGYTGEDGFEIFGDHQLISKLWQDLMNKDVKACGLGARDVLRLEVCYPLYGNELNDEITPLDAGLKWTVKLNKDTFIGKETLQDYQPKFRTLKLMLEKGIPRTGYTVENEAGETIGVVTSGTQSVVLKKGIAMAQIDRNLYQDEEKLNINIRDRRYPAQINKKPFVTGGHK